MKILHINETMGFVGGTERYLFDIACSLKKRGHENHLLFAQISTCDLDEFSSPFLMLKSAGRQTEGLLEVFAKHSPDVCLIHRWKSFSDLLPLIFRIPSFRFIHDHDLWCLRQHKFFYVSGKACHKSIGAHCFFCLPFSRKVWPQRLFSWPNAIGLLRQELNLNAQHLVSCFVGSKFMKQELLRNGFPSEKVKVLPLFTRIPANPVSPPPLESRRIIFVGQVVRGKGLDLLLHALALLRSGFELDVVGEGNARESCMKLMVRLHLKNRVRFWGQQSKAVIGQLLQQARVVVVPSRWPEPFGLVGIEAMANKRPVIAFNVGGISDWLIDGETGFLVKEGNVQELGAKIETLLDDPALSASMGEKGQKLVMAKFNAKNHIDRLEQLLCHG